MRSRKHRRKRPEPERPDAIPDAAGDWRGPYGYGHRAYRPDPQAHYVFDPGPPRILPPSEPPAPEPKVLWKRPMR